MGPADADDLVHYEFKVKGQAGPLYVVMAKDLDESGYRPKEIKYERGPKRARLDWATMTARIFDTRG